MSGAGRPIVEDHNGSAAYIPSNHTVSLPTRRNRGRYRWSANQTTAGRGSLRLPLPGRIVSRRPGTVGAASEDMDRPLRTPTRTRPRCPRGRIRTASGRFRCSSARRSPHQVRGFGQRLGVPEAQRMAELVHRHVVQILRWVREPVGLGQFQRTMTFGHECAPQIAYPPNTFPPAVGL